MKKLLIVGSNSVHVYNYIELVKNYFDDILLITDKKREGSTIKTIEADFHLKPLNRIKTVNKIKKTIREFSPSVLHVHQANSYGYFALKAASKFQIPKILTVWGSDILLLPHRGLLFKKLVQYNLLHADAFTADAKFMADEMQKLVNGKKLDISMANFGIDLPQLKLPKENIIYSNRLHKKLYRIDKTISAFKLFLDNNPSANWELIIAATGEETNNLMSQVDQLKIGDKVKFVGWVNKEQNAEYYAKAKLFISIPESDATAISLLEAMAYGCIPVLSDLPANKEWIENEKNGIIVNSLSEDFIGRALKLNNHEVALMNEKIILEKGTKDANRKKFFQLYDKLLNQK
jgi:glycosyltransferase involved in cell wall biosynthesis